MKRTTWLGSPGAYLKPALWILIVVALAVVIDAALDSWSPALWLAWGLVQAYVVIGLQQRDEQARDACQGQAASQDFQNEA